MIASTLQWPPDQRKLSADSRRQRALSDVVMTFLTSLKARPGGAPGWDWPSYMQGRCPTDPLCAGRHRYHRRKPTAIGNVARPERRLPSFGPSGHVGADAHSTPRPTAWAARRCVSDGAWTARGPSLRLLDPEASQDQRQGHSLRSRPYASLRADPCP